MARKIVDLSILLEKKVKGDPPVIAPKIQHFDHSPSFGQTAPFFSGLKIDDLPDSKGWAIELVNLCTHNGTQMEAPYQFHSAMNKAMGHKVASTTIDQVSLEWSFQSVVKRDFRHFANDFFISCFHDKIRSTSAGWTRALALFDNRLSDAAQ